MTVKTLGVVSLGCSKNLVDTEMMVGILEKDGYKMVDDLDDAQVIFVNTCTFIDAAKEESIQTILQAAEYKSRAFAKNWLWQAVLHSNTRRASALNCRKWIFSSEPNHGSLFPKH